VVGLSLMAAGATTRSHRSRLRLLVVQALVFSLFATLFVRLYYLQVVGGEESYQAKAASQSVRDIVVQPQRGLDRRRRRGGRWSPTARRGSSRSTARCSPS
jgi:cell division protein FtsI/penicillin-binding protein 2